MVFINFPFDLTIWLTWFAIESVRAQTGPHIINPPRLYLEAPILHSPPFETTYGARAIDIKSNSTLNLRCVGGAPVSWTYPQNVYEDTIGSVAKMSDNCTDKAKLCTSTFELKETSYDQTGLYSCQYKDSAQTSPENSDSFYIFVNDNEYLLVPYEGNEFIFISVVQSHPATIPCIPTNSKANVTLWKMHTRSGVPEQFGVGENYGVTYDPTRGFHFMQPSWDGESSFLECRASYGSQSETQTVTIHWSIDPVYGLHPLIDDAEAKHVSINSTFSLNCLVTIEIGVIIAMTWSHPNPDKTRIIEGEAKTTRTGVGGNRSDIVSRKLTVINAQPEDDGLYFCNVSDAHGKIYSTDHKITVYDSSSPYSVNFTMDFDNRKPMIRNVGEEVQFVVNVYAIPDLASFTLFWEKDGNWIADGSSRPEDGELLNGRVHYKASLRGIQSIISIDKVNIKDSGVYSLIANGTDILKNISMTLLVQGRPFVEFLDIQRYYTLNQTYFLKCMVTGYPKPKIWWRWFSCEKGPEACKIASAFIGWKDVDEKDAPNMVNNETLLTEDGKDPELGKDGHLVLKVTAHKSGIYGCFAQNYNGTSSKTVLFIVTDAKDGFSVSSSTDEPIEKNDINLTCNASVFNYTQLNWFWAPSGNASQPVPITNLSNERLTVKVTSSSYSHRSQISLLPAYLTSSGDYYCNATLRSDPTLFHSKVFKLIVQKIVKPKLISTNMEGNLFQQKATTEINFYCKVSGKPRPEVVWFKNNEPLKTDNFGVETGDEGQRLTIRRLVVDDSGRYECRVNEKGGRMSFKRFATLKVTGGEGIKPGGIVLVVSFVVIGCVFVVMAVFLGKRIREERRNKRELEFLSANLFDQGQLEMYNPDMPLDEQVELLPYDRRWEFPKERLKLGRTLGQGAFGRVVRAEAVGLDDSETATTVAVKMLKERADSAQRKALMAELKILIHLGRHLNIVNLLGAVTNNIIKGELYVIVEYCRFGNLRHFLLAHRDSFVNQIDPETGEIDASISKTQAETVAAFNNRIYANTFGANGLNNPNYNMKQMRYAELLHESQSSEDTGSMPMSAPVILSLPGGGTNDSGSGTGSVTGDDGNSMSGYRGESIKKTRDRVITTCDLICYSFQVTRGMEYLASRKLIHRDLAARNVLLAEENVVKICDFGLAKDCYKYDNYVKKGDGPLPIKWMAIESIRDKVSTIKSDVWSFAVLTWEFFTLGGNPYPGIEIDEEFYKKLKNGYRMEKPELCPNFVYEIMKHCWDPEPKERPDFTQLSETLGNLLEASVRQHYLDLNDPYQEMNQHLQENQYLSMRPTSESSQPSDYLNMRPGSNPLDHYDAVGEIRPVGDGPVPKEAMEVVPMIQLDSYADHGRGATMMANNGKSNGTAPQLGLKAHNPFEDNDYLKMNGIHSNLVNNNLNHANSTTANYHLSQEV